jgi:periplasmic divalent cation tolerance protein
MSEACVILTTTDSDEEALRIARSLVEARLAACVQRLAIESTYAWEGAVEEAREVLLLIKTSADRYREVEAWIAEHHTYKVPEVLLLRAPQGSVAYLGWLEAATRSGPS